MKKLMSIVLAVLLCCALLAGCGGSGKTTESTPPADTNTSANTPPAEEQTPEETAPLKFGLVVKNLSNPFFISMVEGAQRACDELGIVLDVQATTDDTQINEQINILDTMTTQNYDAIVVSPLNNVSVVPWLVRANEADIPVVNVDTAFDEDEMTKQGAHVICKIYGDNISAGEAAANSLVEALGGSGKVAMIEGTSGASSAEDRKTGFYSVMDATPGMEVVASMEAKYNRNEAYTVMTNILAAHPDVQAVYAANDEMALGAIAAIEEAGKTGQILVIGTNYTAEIQESMKAGTAYGSVNQDPDWQGYQAVMSAYDFLNGKTPEYIMMSESQTMYE